MGSNDFVSNTVKLTLEGFTPHRILRSSLQPQLKMLISNDDFCGSLSTSSVKSTLDYTYALGGAAGLFFGWIADRVGRRPVAITGVISMVGCCIG